MGTKNSRLAGLYLSSTLSGSYTLVSKTHGLNLSLSADKSDDSSHGDTFKSGLFGLMDFSAKLSAWYNSADATLKSLAINHTSEYFLAYPDRTDTTNYWRGQAYFGLTDFNMDLGQTVDEGYELIVANADIRFVNAGTAL